MRRIFTTFLMLLVTLNTVIAQNSFIDTLKYQLSYAKQDTSGTLLMANLCYFYRYTNTDSSLYYGNRALALSRQLKFVRGEADALTKLGLVYRETGDFPKSLEFQFKALKIAEENNYLIEKANCLRRIGLVFRDLEDFRGALSYGLSALRLDVAIGNKRGETIQYMSIGTIYQLMAEPDSALDYEQKVFESISYIKDLAAEVYRALGTIYVLKGNKNYAVDNFQKGIETGLEIKDFRTISHIYANMAALYKKSNQPDSAIVCALKGLSYGGETHFKKGIMLSANLLSELYESENPAEALKYYKIARTATDSLFGAGNIKTIQKLITRENERQKEIMAAKIEHKNLVYTFLAGIGILLLIAFILYRNNRQKQRANNLLNRQKEEINLQRYKAEKMLSELKSTQSQLIQSEKMASLGELTAGIAHEIQNPLNFVNNFSEVNQELLLEMKEEMDNGKMDEAKALANDVFDNEKKINHHGKRADSIVKGMLQHSRSSSGVKELTDINKLTDEFLRLSYHGLRAKDKTFNASLKTNFDSTIEKINVVTEEVGRVILNLLNNAFYAVTEKKRLNPEGYEPTVSVSTQKIGDIVEIKVQDNGNGIPQKVLDKIFQPFFTTKPAGQGTGLGLSLSYDIVKAHGGELKVESVEDQGTEFIVVIPLTT